jgi:hypothetical protein
MNVGYTTAQVMHAVNFSDLAISANLLIVSKRDGGQGCA